MFACGVDWQDSEEVDPASGDNRGLVGLRFIGCEYCSPGNYNSGGQCRPEATHLTSHLDEFENQELDPFVIQSSAGYY